MKKKLILVMLLLLALLTGCQIGEKETTKNTTTSTTIEDTKAFDTAMDKGNTAIVDKEFDKAEAAFELALEYNQKSEKAKNYLKQVSIYMEALQKFNEGDYSKASALLNQLKETNGSKNMAKYADDLQLQVTKAVEKQKQAKVEPVSPPKVAVRKYSVEEQQAISQEFLNWAIYRAVIGNMSVSSEYFGHGSGGLGDWYALTVDGRIRTQAESAPGYDAFELHSLGGVVFFTSLDGSVGLNESFASTAAGYSLKADPEKRITKYILADTGNIYEYGDVGKNMMAFSNGFTEATNDGQFVNDAYLPVFQQSQDVDAINKLNEILANYN